MKKSMCKKIISIVFVGMMLFCVQTVSASDDLLLNGVVQSIDKGNGLITFNVMTESCKGMRTFRVPDKGKSDLDDSIIGMNLQFQIDSARCEKGSIHNVIAKEKP